MGGGVCTVQSVYTVQHSKAIKWCKIWFAGGLKVAKTPGLASEYVVYDIQQLQSIQYTLHYNF